MMAGQPSRRGRRLRIQSGSLARSLRQPELIHSSLTMPAGTTCIVWLIILIIDPEAKFEKAAECELNAGADAGSGRR